MKKLVFGIFLMTVVSFSAWAQHDLESVLVGRWGHRDINVTCRSVQPAELTEYFADGTGRAEFGVRRFLRTRRIAVDFTWRVDEDGRVVVETPGETQIFTVVEISDTTVVTERYHPRHGIVRSTSIRRR